MTYIVQHGDSLWSIANLFGVSIESIVSANRISQSDPLIIGQRLSIPKKSSQSSASVHQTISNLSVKLEQMERKFAQLEEIVDYHSRQIAELRKKVGKG